VVRHLKEVLRSIRSLFRRRREEQQLNEELQFHLQRQIEQNLAAGMPPEEARYAALRLFGGVQQIKEECRDMRSVSLIENLAQDVRYGLRMLARSRGLTAIVLLSLALGIGANTAIFSLIDAVLLKALPVQNPQELALLNWSSHGWAEDIMSNVAGDMDQDKTGRMTSTSFSYAVYEQMRTHSQVFSSVLALAGNDSQLNLGYQGEPGRAEGELVSGTFFSSLGVEPILGRFITPDDDRFGASPVAVISYGYWERRFGRDAGIVGRKITVNSVPFTIAGVCPPEFYGIQPGRSEEVWLPLHTQPLVEPTWSGSGVWNGAGVPPGSSLFTRRENWWLVIMGRLKPGITFQQARPELEVLLQRAMALDIKPSTKPETIPHLELLGGSKGLNDLRNQFSKPLFILMTVVGLVLLIACANVANLLLARAATRQREIAVRLAIGAARRRLIRQLLTESMLLAALGGALGLIFAFWGTHVLMAFMSSGRDPLRLSVTLDLRVLVFTAGVSVLTGILFGLSPALQTTRVDLTPALKETGAGLPGAAQTRRGMRLGLGKTLVIVQIGLSLLLLVGAGLFVRTLTNLEHVNTGFDQHNLLLFGIDPTQDGYQQQRLASFYQELTRRLAALPGVHSVSASHNTLVGGGANMVRTRILGYTPKAGEKDNGVEASLNTVGPHFFETMGIPLVLGRSLGESDTESAPKAAVVNQSFARDYLGDGSPIGRRFGFGDAESSAEIAIVGVVADAKFHDLREEIPPTIYLPFLQGVSGETAVLGALGAMHFEVRTTGDPLAIAPAVRRVAQAMDPNLALYDVRSQTEQINQTLFQERLFARLTGLFGILAALLGCIGMNGIMAFATTGRTREIGIRMALGASRVEILGMVLRETFMLLAIGITAGTLVALEASRLVGTLLYGLKPSDPLTIAGAALLMLAAAAVAGYLPARRASRVDPMVALRYE
jgi:predicted permease